VGGNAGRGRPKRTFIDQIGEVLEGPGREYLKPASVYEVMTVEETKGVCKVANGRKCLLTQRDTGVMLCMFRT
jgi:hypothetical protein